MNGVGGVRLRGHPKSDEMEIEKLLNKKVYRHYLERISDLNPNWTVERQHRYPRNPGPVRFYNYAVVKVKSNKISPEIKGKKGHVRDREAFERELLLESGADLRALGSHQMPALGT